MAVSVMAGSLAQGAKHATEMAACAGVWRLAALSG